jgi:hypothetical protein
MRFTCGLEISDNVIASILSSKILSRHHTQIRIYGSSGNVLYCRYGTYFAAPPRLSPFSRHFSTRTHSHHILFNIDGSVVVVVGRVVSFLIESSRYSIFVVGVPRSFFASRVASRRTSHPSKVQRLHIFDHRRVSVAVSLPLKNNKKARYSCTLFRETRKDGKEGRRTVCTTLPLINSRNLRAKGHASVSDRGHSKTAPISQSVGPK